MIAHVDHGIPRRRSDLGSPSHDAQPLCALIVDDSPDDRAYLRALARRCGFTVDEAVDGSAALELLVQKPFDIVLVDQQMPRLTGLEVICEIRKRPELKTIFAVMLTAHDDQDRLQLRPLEDLADHFQS